MQSNPCNADEPRIRADAQSRARPSRGALCHVAEYQCLVTRTRPATTSRSHFPVPPASLSGTAQRSSWEPGRGGRKKHFTQSSPIA